MRPTTPWSRKRRREGGHRLCTYHAGSTRGWTALLSHTPVNKRMRHIMLYTITLVTQVQDLYTTCKRQCSATHSVYTTTFVSVHVHNIIILNIFVLSDSITTSTPVFAPTHAVVVWFVCSPEHTDNTTVSITLCGFWVGCRSYQLRSHLVTCQTYSHLTA